MNEEIKEKVAKIFKHELSSDEIEEFMTFLRETFKNSIVLDEEDAFFKTLAYEMKGDLKGLAVLMSDFRSELKARIHPDLTEVAFKYIPQTSDQLEGIIETTEMATNKIMDNLEIMQADIDATADYLGTIRSGQLPKSDPSGGNGAKKMDDDTLSILAPVLGHIEASTAKQQSLISDSFIQMSFQDLTGQRIKKIINLVSQMEERITRMVISFGIKLSEKEKNPDISNEELQRAVDEKVELLAGPQRSGEGLDQSEIDALLADL